jgi:hypothetical protein
MLEAEKNRGCTGSFGRVPIQPQTGVHPTARAHPTLTSIAVLPGEVTVHQLTCHFTSLHSVSLLRVTRDQEIAREEILLQ